MPHFDWSRYHGNLDWLEKNTILFVRHGSHAYGLNIETSDEDFKGVTVPPSRYRNGFVDTFAQAESKNPDFVVYDVRKFMKLAADANPSVLEVMFIDDENLLRCTPAGTMLRDARRQFLSRKVRHTYGGYAYQQLKRLRGHYEWHQKGTLEPPTRAAFGLKEKSLISKEQLQAAQSMIRKQLESWILDNLDSVDDSVQIAIQNKMTDILAEISLANDASTAARFLGFQDNFIELLDKERQYKAAVENYQSWCEWKENRNATRAADEAKFGYDPKFAMHAMRLLFSAEQLLKTGDLNVKPDIREYLLGIRRGEEKFEPLMEVVETKMKGLAELAAQSPLPREPNRAELSRLCERIIESMP